MIWWLLPSIHWNSSDVLTSWCVGLLLLSFVYASYIKEHLGWLISVTTLYVLLESLYVFALEGNRYGVLGNYKVSLQEASLYTTVIFIMMTFMATRIKKHSVNLSVCAPWFGVCNAIYVIIGAIFGFGKLVEGVGFSGIINYSGMNAVLMVFSVPFLLDESICGSLWASSGLVLIMIAIVLSHATIPYGVLAVVLGAYFLHRYKKVRHLFGYASLPIAFGALIRGSFMLDDAYRFKAYEVFMSAWAHSGRKVIAFGSGTGTYQSLAPLIQISNNFMVNMGPNHHDNFFWIFMHSDWLECLFEYGVIGLALFIACYSQVMFRLFFKKSSSFFALCAGLGASAVFDFPLRYFSTALFITLTVGVAFE